MDELGIDMEELESRLYGRVFHASAENQDLPSRNEFRPDPGDALKRAPRYFKFAPTAPPEGPAERGETTPDFIPLASRYYEGAKGLIQMLAPCSNIVLLPPAPTQIIGSSNLEKYVNRERVRELKRLKRKRRKQLKKQLKRVQVQEQERAVTVDDVIVLSDSDVSDCVEVPEKRELVVLSSDDECKPSIKREGDLPELKTDDDVIFVEPEPRQVEVIDVDCDPRDDEKHSETTSTTNSDNIKVPGVPRRPRRAAGLRELRTPDSSASNDFLDGAPDSSHAHFNFGLHGADFANCPRRKPADASEETDSTASDAAAPRPSCFSTVDFEVPLFGADLESFGEYITPNRPRAEETPGLERVQTRASGRVATPDGSDSSSESDYDGYLGAKRLPDLSAVHAETGPADDSSAVGEIPVGQMPGRGDAKRKLDDDDASSKRRRVDGAAMEADGGPDFVVIDETGGEDDSNDTESYFSCDGFDDMTSDLALGNCDAPERGGGDGRAPDAKIDYLNYSIEEVHRTMSDDPELWKILDIDRLHFRYATPRGPRCHRCREFGHMALHCTNKQGRPACTLCGERTHTEPRCPMAMCTSCGRLGGHTTYCSYCASWRNIQCSICKLYGHIDIVCPDAWRRYHLTTKPGPIVRPAVQTLKPEGDRWCSGCAQSGHFESACRHYNRTHFAVYPEVLHYVDLYNFPKSRPYVVRREDGGTDTDDQTAPDESFHDAETGSPGKAERDDAEADAFDMYFKVSFPPPDFIPPYFRSQMSYLKKRHLRGRKRSSAKSPSLEGFVSDTEARAQVKVPQRSNRTLRLDRLQFAYVHSKHGIDFFNDIKRRAGVQLFIEKHDDAPGGEIHLSGSSEANVSNVKRDILHFLRNMPCIEELPYESKDMLEFLLRHKEKLDKAKGNCWTLCKKLLKLTNLGNRDGWMPEQVRWKDNMQVTVQLLLFGKLKLERGGEHVARIHEWIRTVRDRPNYTLPLDDIFEVYRSYAYLFKPRRSIYPFKNLCAQHDHYILPTADGSKRRKMPQRNRMYVENKSKFVMDTCKRYNLPNKFVTELVAIQGAMQASRYSRICYVDFLRFMSRFRTYMKRHKIL